MLDFPSACQAMRFGDLPAWAEALSKGIHESVIRFAGSLDIDIPDSETPLASPILWREPLFDQMIVNSYQPGEVSVRSSTQHWNRAY